MILINTFLVTKIVCAPGAGFDNLLKTAMP